MHKFIYILLFLLTSFSAAKAQDNNDVNVDSLVRALKEEYQENHISTTTTQETGSVDTALIRNQLTISADSVENWKRLKPFAYAKYLDSLLKAKQEKDNLKKEPTYTKSDSNGSSWLDDVFSSPITKVFFWVLAGLFVLFILYKLFLTDGALRKRSKTGQADTPQVSEEVISGESDFDGLVAQAIRGGNYRMAVRYQYLKVLHRLAEKNFIELAADKTNYQYVREVVSRGGPAVNQQFQNEFASLTLSYEYVWYGEFGVDDAIYRRIETGFTHFNQKI